MAGKLSDVKVGMPSRSMSLHKKDTPSSTTLNFGEVAPLACFFMDGNTKIRGNVGTIVRMPPLPRPVFGELMMKQYARFVPIKEVYRNFENFRGARSLTTQFGTFTPSVLPYVSVQGISRILLDRYCYFDLYHSDQDPQPVSDADGDKQLIYGLKYQSEYQSQLVRQFNNLYGTSLSNSTHWATNRRSNNVSPITMENCDFFLTTNTQTGSVGSNVFVFRLTRLGKVLYRILRGFQYGFDIDNTKPVSFLPLFAFYKAYFDLFVPANTASGNRNYTDTNCFRLCDYICEHDIQNLYSTDTTANSLLISFLKDLSECFYYQDPDFITSAIASPSISPATSTNRNKDILMPTNYQDSHTDPLSLSQITFSKSNGIPRIYSSSVQEVTSYSLKLLLRLLPYINKDTVIGGRLRQLIKSRFGYDAETLEGISYTAGKFDLPIEISALTNSADTAVAGTTDGKQLGWQGGQGVGYNKRTDKGKLESLHFDFSTKKTEPGFFMILCVVVPKAGFFQGIAPYLSHGMTGRFSCFDPAFDSLGFDLLTKDVLVGSRTTRIAPVTSSGVTTFAPKDLGKIAFGFVPRYFDYKTQPLAIKSGDIVRQWAKKIYSAYYVDKLISTDDDSLEVTYHDPSEGGDRADTYDVVVYDNIKDLPTATPELRRIGYDQWLENFNRIFYQTGLYGRSQQHSELATPEFDSAFGIDDNFICDNFINVDYFDHSKPSSESFETDGEGVSFSIDHA